MRKVELVKFKDGKYDVRRKRLFCLGYEFFSGSFWWSDNEKIDEYCKHSYQHAKHFILNRVICDYGEPVEFDD